MWHTFPEGGNSFGFHCSSIRYSFKEDGKILRVTEKIVAMLVSGGALVVRSFHYVMYTVNLLLKIIEVLNYIPQQFL